MSIRRKGYISIAIFAALAVVFSAVMAAAFLMQEEVVYAEDVKVPTKVTSIAKSYSMTRYDKTVSDTIKVSPALGRKVVIYYYNKSIKKWEKCKTFKLAKTKTAKITIKYPYYWKQHYSSKYKVKIPAKTVTEEVPADGNADAGNKTTYAAYSQVVKFKNRTLPGATSIVMKASTGEIIAERGMHEKRKIASVTKMMTALLLTESGNLREKTVMTKEAANTRWALGLKAGDKLKGTQLLKLMMIGSCNEAAAQAGILASGSTKEFIKAADKRAEELGALNTHYENAHGIDSGTGHTNGNYSTAYDQAKIASYIMTAEVTKPIRNSVLISKYYVKKRGRYIGRRNTNYLLGKDGNIGLKTGTERTAKNCFVGAYNYNGEIYITVVLGAATSGAKWSGTVNLKNYMKYSVKKGYKTFY